MRFSLATLLIFLLWVGAMVGVWSLSCPWVMESRIYAPADVDESRAHGWCSPDGTRMAYLAADVVTVVSNSANTVESQFTIQNPNHVILKGFVDDDTLLFCIYGEHFSVQYFFYHRRFPEWWWGHFYRPELWLAIILGALWLWRVIRWRRMRQSAKV